MNARLYRIPYQDDRDFVRVRDFLTSSYHRTGQARNWAADRWPFCRGFAHTVHGTTDSWPKTVGPWTDAEDRVRAVACSEGEGRGEAHFFLDWPEEPPTELVRELFDHAESALTRTGDSGPGLSLRLWDGSPVLAAEAIRRGYRRAWTEVMSHRPIHPDDTPALPGGYRIIPGTELPNEAKGRAHARAFGYAGSPQAALAPEGWAGIRRQPGWRGDLELFVLAPDGRPAAFANLWLDPLNRLAVLEPVGTDPDHRHQGLARALVVEGGRRASALGAGELLVGSDQPFYRACGFQPRERHGVWEKVGSNGPRSGDRSPG